MSTSGDQPAGTEAQDMASPDASAPERGSDGSWELVSSRSSGPSGTDTPPRTEEEGARLAQQTARAAQSAAPAARRPCRRDEAMEAYAHMVYWQIRGLLQKSYGEECSEDVVEQKRRCLAKFGQLLERALQERRRPRGQFAQGEADRAALQVAMCLSGNAPSKRLASMTIMGDGGSAGVELDGTSDSKQLVAPEEDDAAGLIRVWGNLDGFQYTEIQDSDGRLLVPALPSGKAPTVASKEVFLGRFHARTSGIFEDFDWSHLRVIGGMMPACLVMDDEDFKSDAFHETDVDLYVVGLTGAPFKERVVRAITDLYTAARQRGLQAVVLKTPCTISISLRGPSGPIPNIQVVTSPFQNTRHLLLTTDIDITGFGFDGDELFATDWAREAVAHRRNIARPEKYNIRGEFCTESRLLKYAMRGFRVVDTGLPCDLEVPQQKDVEEIAAQAAAAFWSKAAGGGAEAADGPATMDGTSRSFEHKMRATGVTGAHLLLLARKNPGLQQLLLFDVPLLPAGMADARLLALLRGCDASDGYERLSGGRPVPPPEQKRGGKPLKPKLKLLFPSKLAITAEEALKNDVLERDPDARVVARSWYTGLEDVAKVCEK